MRAVRGPAMNRYRLMRDGDGYRLDDGPPRWSTASPTMAVLIPLNRLRNELARHVGRLDAKLTELERRQGRRP